MSRLWHWTRSPWRRIRQSRNSAARLVTLCVWSVSWPRACVDDGQRPARPWTKPSTIHAMMDDARFTDRLVEWSVHCRSQSTQTRCMQLTSLYVYEYIHLWSAYVQASGFQPPIANKYYCCCSGWVTSGTLIHSHSVVCRHYKLTCLLLLIDINTLLQLV